MRHHLIVWINGVRQMLSGGDAFLPLSTYLRDRLGLVGTKVMCAEGDCGACTVLVAKPGGSLPVHFLPIDSCIRFMFQLDGCHVITAEGLACDGPPTAVQQAMIDCHGSQCGFCTPGMVMAITAGCQATSAGNGTPARADGIAWRRELAGNLCRCTGYLPIFEAALQAEAEPVCLSDRFTTDDWLAEAGRLRRDSLDVSGELEGVSLRVTSPASLREALAIRREPDARVVAGATDLGVLWNKGTVRPRYWLDLSRVSELETLAVTETPTGSRLAAGPLVTWTDLLAACRERCPEFVSILEAFGGPQIRHVGTLGGNIVNGSPIADAVPLLMVMEASLHLASAEATRTVPIGGFFTGYRQLDLAPDELLVGISLPLPTAAETLRLVKVSRRRDLDISTFTAAILIGCDQERIVTARIAYGGVGPTVLRLPETEAMLAGQPFTEATFRRAGDRAAAEIRPLADVRGSADYRRRLARNVLLRFFHERTVGAR